MLASALAGLIVIGFEAVEVPIIDRFASALPTAVPQQALMTVLGLACLGLAISLWIVEYQGRSLLIKHAGHLS